MQPMENPVANPKDYKSFEDIQIEVAQKSAHGNSAEATKDQPKNPRNVAIRAASLSTGINLGDDGVDVEVNRITRFKRRLNFSFLVVGIFLAIIAFPLFDIWAFFNIFDMDVSRQATTLGMVNVVIRVFAEFFLAFKMFPGAFPNKGVLVAGFSLFSAMRCGLVYMARYITSNTPGIDEPPAYVGIPNMAIDVLLSVCFMPVFFGWLLKKTRTPDPSNVPRKSWDPQKESKLHFLLLIWAILIGTVFSLYIYTDIGDSPILVSSQVSNATNVDYTTNRTLITITTVSEYHYEAPMIYNWIVLVSNWLPFGLLCLMILAEKLKPSPNHNYGYSVKHLAVYLWVLKTLPFCVGTMLNAISSNIEENSEFRYFISIAFILFFLILEQVTMHCLSLVDGHKNPDVHYVFPLFFYEYYFAQLFFVDLSITNSTLFWGLLGLQSVWLTFRNSGLVKEWGRTMFLKLKRFVKLDDGDEDLPIDAIFRLQVQVRIALQFLMCDMFSIILVPALYAFYLTMLVETNGKLVGRILENVLGLENTNGTFDLSASLGQLFLRYFYIFIIKMPFHIFAFFIIRWKHQQCNKKLRKKEQRKLRIFEVCHNHLQHGWSVFIVFVCLAAMLSAYSTMNNMFHASMLRTVGQTTPTGIIHSNSTMDGSMNVTHVYQLHLHLTYDDTYYLSEIRRWFS